MIRVSAGVIRRADGKILICKRGEGRKNAHLWEFPGGKQESGEDASMCLKRELQEELLLTVQTGDILCTEEKEGIIFDFVQAETESEPTLTEHEAMAWVTPREMLRYTFCPADTDVARRMALSDPPLKNFLWDFDGTIMNTYPAMVQAVIHAAEKQGIHPSADEVTSLMMHDLRHCVHTIAEKNGGDEEQLYLDYRREEAAIPPAAIHVMPGMAEALRILKQQGGRHFLVTHRGKDAWEYLTWHGLKELFEGGVTRDDHLPRKPAPDMILHVMHEYGLKGEETIMIGDRPLDTESGRRAGVMTCMLDTSGRFAQDPAELYAKDVPSLMAILQGMPVCLKDLHL